MSRVVIVVVVAVCCFCFSACPPQRSAAHDAGFAALEAHRRAIAEEEVASPLPREIPLTRPVTHVVDSAVQLTPRIELLPVTGHTEGDLVVTVADVDVALLGGIGWFGSTPLALHGDPALDDLRIAEAPLPGLGAERGFETRRGHKEDLEIAGWGHFGKVGLEGRRGG